MTERGRAKIMDFGLAKRTEPQQEAELAASAMATASLPEELLTTPGAAVGTVAYMSPEQARGEELDARTDLFSFGAVLYEMATGRPPFTGTTSGSIFEAIFTKAATPVTELNPSVPTELQRIIEKALEKDRDDRYQSAREIVADLRRLRRYSGVTASVPSPAAPKAKNRRFWILAAAGLVLIGAAIALLKLAVPRVPVVVRTTQLTHSSPSLPKSKFRLVTDGLRLYFNERVTLGGNRVELRQVSAAGGEAVSIPTGSYLPLLMDISADGSRLLFGDMKTQGASYPLYVMPALGGASRRVGQVLANCAAWSPDGNRIAFGRFFDGLYVADADGANPQKIANFKVGIEAIHWSPDGRLISYDEFDSSGVISLWQVPVTGGTPLQLLPGWNPKKREGDGLWLRDASWFVFGAARPEGDELWALRQRHDWLARLVPELVQLTSDPIAWESPVVSKDGKRIFAIGHINAGWEASLLDLRTRHSRSLLSGIPAPRGELFPGRRMADVRRNAQRDRLDQPAGRHRPQAIEHA